MGEKKGAGHRRFHADLTANRNSIDHVGQQVGNRLAKLADNAKDSDTLKSVTSDGDVSISYFGGE